MSNISTVRALTTICPSVLSHPSGGSAVGTYDVELVHVGLAKVTLKTDDLSLTMVSFV